MKKIAILFIISMLFSCKAKIEDLILAIENEDVNQIQKLVDRGVDLYNPDLDKEPLYYVCTKKNIEILKIMLDGGLINHVSRFDMDYMTKYQWIEGINLLLDYGLDPDIMISRDWSLLEWSLIYKHKDLTKRLITLGADINSDFDGDGSSSFFTALKYSGKEILTFLVESGADLSIKNYKNQSVTSFLISNSDINRLRYLIDLGADIRSRGINNLNPWEVIADSWSSNALNIAELLWKEGLRFDFEKNLALHLAAEYQHYEYVKWLLEHGIDPDIEDDEGYKADDYAYIRLDYYNPEEEAMGIKYEDLEKKTHMITRIITDYRYKKK